MNSVKLSAFIQIYTAEYVALRLTINNRSLNFSTYEHTFIISFAFVYCILCEVMTFWCGCVACS